MRRDVVLKVSSTRMPFRTSNSTPACSRPKSETFGARPDANKDFVDDEIAGFSPVVELHLFLGALLGDSLNAAA